MWTCFLLLPAAAMCLYCIYGGSYLWLFPAGALFGFYFGFLVGIGRLYKQITGKPLDDETADDIADTIL